MTRKRRALISKLIRNPECHLEPKKVLGEHIYIYYNEDPRRTHKMHLKNLMLTAQLLGNIGTDIFETTRQAYLVTFEGVQNLDQHLRSVAEQHG